MTPNKSIKLIILMISILLVSNFAYAFVLVPQTLKVNGYVVHLNVPIGMQVDYLVGLNAPRFFILGPDQEFIIGSRGSDLYRVKRPYRNSETLVSLQGKYHSVTFRSGQIFAAETGGLYVADYSGADDSLLPEDFSLVTELPSETGGHWSRTVMVGHDAKLYIGIGISGNCSDEYLDDSYPFERRRGGVFVVDENSIPPQLSPYSSGLRNPIGLAFHPQTKIIYATNAGPDNLGFYQPPEIFVGLSQGSYHGMPWFQYYNGAFRSGGCATSNPPRPAGEATPPNAAFAARSTPEGLAFVTNSRLGGGFNGNALVAIHGSWAVPPGGGPESRRPPKIVMVRFSGGNPIGTEPVVEDIVTGFQRSDGSRFARPCGMVMGPDGYLYFTSDAGEVTGLFRLRPSQPDPTSHAGLHLAPVYHLMLN